MICRGVGRFIIELMMGQKRIRELENKSKYSNGFKTKPIFCELGLENCTMGKLPLITNCIT